MTAPPADALVLARTEVMERRALRLLSMKVWMDVAVLACLVPVSVFMIAASIVISPKFIPLAAILVVPVAGYGFSLFANLRWRNRERQLRGFQLWIAPQGVTYTTVVGNFSAPWSAVRRVAYTVRPVRWKDSQPGLYIDVEGWGGPLSTFGQVVCSLWLPLDGTGTGIDTGAVADAVQRHSDHRITVSGDLLPGFQRRTG